MLTRDDPKAGDRQVESLGQPAQGFEPLRLVDRVAVVEVDDGRGGGTRPIVGSRMTKARERFRHFIVGIPKFAAGFTPSRQRAVTVLMRE